MNKKNKLILAVPLIAILLGLVIYHYGFLRVQAEVVSIKEAQDIKTKTLGKYLAFISEKPHLEKKLSLLKEQRKADDSKIIDAQTPSLAAATLQETVKGIVTGRGGTISSERVGKPEDLGKFKVVTISIDAVLPDTRVLTDILYAIETRTPYLAVKELDTRIRNFNEQRELIVKLDVSAITTGK